MEAPIKTTEEFLRAVRAAFGFLEADYGFHLAEAVQIPVQTFPAGRQAITPATSAATTGFILSVRYEAEPIRVQITDDPRGETQLVLSRITPAGREHADLWHLLQYAHAPELRRGWLYEYGTTSFNEVIRSLGAGLQRYGGPFLRDEPGAWADLGRAPIER